MKHLRKIMAFIISMVMTVSTMGTMPAFAAEGAPADTSISVTNLNAGDKVNFYKVLEFDETATATGGWVAATGFTGLKTAEIQKILGLDANGKPVDTTAEGYVAKDWGIDTTLAGKISQMAEANGVNPKFANVVASEGGAATTATTAVGDAGLYVALIDPVTTGDLYNPVFVGADFSAGGTNTQPAVTILSYADTALAKKEDVTLTKEIDGSDNTKYDVNIGDEVSFTITSKVPAFSTAYQEPVYEITDTMEAGLALKALPTVEIQDITLDEADFTITPASIGDTDVTTFTVKLNKTGLDKVAAKGIAKTITVKYTATVKTIEDATVTEKENEATVKFSNNPEDSESYSLLEDKTRSYTFTIDGKLLGYEGTSYETDELIKTGLNADGTSATQTFKYHSATQFTELSPLAGAKFALYKESPEAADYANEAAAIASNKLYKNSVFNGIATSDSNGRLKIEGLDVGKYYLHEVSAPTGYIADNRTFTITISADYTEIAGGTYTNNEGIKVKYDAYMILNGYTVTVNDGNGNTTSTYNIENKGQVQNKVVDKATYVHLTGEDADWAGDNVTPISNTKGTELPSTGGIGTTIFYVVGGCMVAGAVVFLLTKRRISSNE
jgi:fimbrial isopeptide formation D2 family protein/LPXTG-motif cell wall-anchored protein